MNHKLQGVRVRTAYMLFAAACSAFVLEPWVGADTLSFRQGVDGYAGTVDTTLKESSPNSVFSASSSFEWDADDPFETGLANFALLRFDDLFGPGAGQIPIGAPITTASLTFSVSNAGNPGNLFVVTTDWDGTTSYNNFGPTAGVQSEDFGAIIGEISGTEGTRVMSVTTIVGSWASDPASNLGWIVLPSGSNGVDVRSSNHPTPSERPMLTVTFNEGGPSPILVRKPYLQRGTPNSVVIAWRTDLPGDSLVRYGSAPGELTSVVTDDALVTDHAMLIESLSAGTRYYYQVGTQTQALAGGDAEHYIDTAPKTGEAETFSIWIVGDSGTAGNPQFMVRDAMLAETAGDPPDLFVHVGDMAYLDGRDTEFTDRFFHPYEDILRHTVTWPTMGNHEGHSSTSGTQTGPYYEAYVLPTGAEAGGLPSGTEAYYSFDYANAHFVCLDSHDTDRSPGSTMLTWLEEDLASTDQDWLIAFWHHPPYSKGTHDSDDVLDSDGRLRDMRENVLPILEAGGVDLVLAGHSHIYERSFLVSGAYDTPTTADGHIIDGGDGRPAGDGAYIKPPGLSAQRGAVYVVAGHGGAVVDGPGNHPLMYFSEVVNGSCLLTIDGSNLSLRNIRLDGTITDSFSIFKQLTEPIPTTSTWGAALVVLLLSGAGTIIWGRRRQAAQ